MPMKQKPACFLANINTGQSCVDNAVPSSDVISHSENQAASEAAPWFSTYNRYIGAPGTIRVYPLTPFSAKDFCAHSPWQDHVIIAHHGVEPMAHAAGFNQAEDYLQYRIATSPKRGAFCNDCPNRKCAGGV